MSAPYPRRGTLLFVGMLLLVSVLLEQYTIAPLFPWIGQLGSFRPMLVFLDIPLELPRIDWLPVSILFAVGYSVAIAPELSRIGQRATLRKKVWQALTGWWFLLLLLVAGGGSFYFIQGYLPKQVGNGIDSFGLRADITFPWPSENLIHLHGSMVLLVFFMIGTFILSRRMIIAAAAIEEPAAGAIAAAAQTPRGQPPAPTIRRQPSPPTLLQQPSPPTLLQQPSPPTLLQQPSPPTRLQQPTPPIYRQQQQQPQPTPILVTEPPPSCRYTTPPPVAIIMPRPAIRRLHPCVVTGIVEPKKSRKSTNVLEPTGT